jgi:hypothetical protein
MQPDLFIHATNATYGVHRRGATTFSVRGPMFRRSSALMLLYYKCSVAAAPNPRLEPPALLVVVLLLLRLLWANATMRG